MFVFGVFLYPLLANRIAFFMYLDLDCPSFTLQSLEKAVNSKHLYLEGVHWKKGELLGTGAYSSCYAVRDLMNGSLMAVKQVHFIMQSLAVFCIRDAYSFRTNMG